VKAVVQRVALASVAVEGKVVGSIGPGLLVLLGIAREDDAATAAALAAKVAGLRLFEDAGGHMNLDLAAAGGSVLCVSQFTLYGNVRRGRRPSFDAAAPPGLARPLYEAFCDALRAAGVPCQQGVFGAHMSVSLVNDGPVTLILDTADLAHPRRQS
jgi:D-tyrosyl-tRNA(Tyr) deacylase